MVKTDAECKAMLLSRLENDFHKPLIRCIPGFDDAPLDWQGAMLDEAYNIGVGAASPRRRPSGHGLVTSEAHVMP